MDNKVIGYTKRKTTLYLALCILGFVALQILVVACQRIGFTSFNGVFMAFQFGLCLLMVRFDYRQGFYISLGLNGFALIMLVVSIIVGRTTGPIPGLFNTLIYLFTLSLLARQFRIRGEEAITDVLTGFYNRRGLYNLLKNKIFDKRDFYVVYIDFGDFKLINDNYGHTYGDAIMKLMAQRMSAAVGKQGILSRMGGDEFVIVCDIDVDVDALVEKVLGEIRKKASNSINGTKIDVYLSAYAGIARYPYDADNFESILMYADIAMHEAVRLKTEHAVFFDKSMEMDSRKAIEIEKTIKECLDNDGFYLKYQPQFELEDKKLRGFEALIRMKDNGDKAFGPADFIPVAEMSDLIIAIDDFVLERSIREIKDMLDNDSQVVVSINVSAKNIGNVGFAEKVIKMVEDIGIKPSNLEIEITEYCLVRSVDVTIENIKMLRNYGIQVALDDFGTGYTSLSYLFKMPVDLLKIDKSLIDNVDESNRNYNFVEAVIEMGHIMGCEVIAEGVETQKQVELLKEQKCDLIQGYVWGKPMDIEDAKKLTKF